MECRIYWGRKEDLKMKGLKENRQKLKLQYSHNNYLMTESN